MPSSSARNEIENTLHRYTFGYDNCDWSVVESCFTEGAVLSLRVGDGALVGPYEGREAVLKMMRDASHSQGDQRRHVTTNVIIQEDGHDATSVAYLTLFSAKNGVLTPLSTGEYHDKLLRTSMGWKLSERHIGLDLPY